MLNLTEHRNAPDFKKHISSSNYKGFGGTMIERNTNPGYIKPEINEYIVTHELTKEEKMIYEMMESVLENIRSNYEKLMASSDHKTASIYSTFCLSMIVYLRESLTCPMIP